MQIRSIAGYGIIAASLGLAAMSGNLAYHGFQEMIPIPGAGWIGPFVALSLVGLGVAVECELKEERWWAAGILAVLLIGAAALDKHSGELALKAQVEGAMQEDADRQAAYDTALTAKAAADKTLAGLEGELALLSGADVVAIQKHVGTRPDGNWGGDTALRVATRKDQIETARAGATATSAKWAEVVALGAPVTTLPFTLADAELYALLITVLGVVLAFAGSWVAHPREDLAKLDEELAKFERNLDTFNEWMQAA